MSYMNNQNAIYCRNKAFYIDAYINSLLSFHRYDNDLFDFGFSLTDCGLALQSLEKRLPLANQRSNRQSLLNTKIHFKSFVHLYKDLYEKQEKKKSIQNKNKSTV